MKIVFLISITISVLASIGINQGKSHGKLNETELKFIKEVYSWELGCRRTFIGEFQTTEKLLSLR